MPRFYQLALLRSLTICLSLAALLPVGTRAQGQGPGVDPAEDRSGVHLPSSRVLSRGMQRAKERIEAGEFSQAIRFLNDVLASPEDLFIRGEGQEFVGLKETARTTIRDLPEAGRQAYESTFGPESKRMLLGAVAAGDIEKIAEITSRFFYTPAGYEAALLLAQHESDQGRHLAAALIYQQLLDTPAAVLRFDPQLSTLAAVSWLGAGQPERAEQIIESLRSQGKQSIRIAGERHPLDASAGASLDWLLRTVGEPAEVDLTPERRWLTHRGNLARNGQTSGGMPHLRVHWQSVPLLPHGRLEKIYDDIANEREQNRRALPVAATPLATGDYIITRSAQNLLALDFRTGKLVWQSEPQKVLALEKLINSAAGRNAEEVDPIPARSFAQRIWDDYLYNTISSDGQHVFVIRDLQSPGIGTDGLFMPFMMGGRRAENSMLVGTNRLCAYDLGKQGKLDWEIDGADTRGQMAGVFFLGAPLAIGQSLYCLSEASGAISMSVIDRETGRLQWQQELADVELDIQRDANRRLQASMPSYDSGILVCPIGSGVTIGVDLAKRSLAWAYRYDARPSPYSYRRGRIPKAPPTKSRWIDSSVTLVDGSVLLTPPESDFLHCLDLATGKLQWKVGRDDYLYLGCVDRGRVLLVGEKQLSALRLSDGEPAWQQAALALPPHSAPSGRGFLSDGRYYLPLSSAEVVAIDVDTGAIVSRSESRDGQVLGNLICHRGAVLSQNGRFLERYDQIEVLQKRSEKVLADNPNDVVALRTLGEIAYNAGDVSEAIVLLERSYLADTTDVQTHEVLSECLVAALDDDFSGFRQRLPLLEKLQLAPGRGQVALLRVQAKGLLEVGQPLESLDVCLEMFRLADEPSELLAIGKQRRVRVTRWLRAQTLAIWNSAAADQRKLLTKKLTEAGQQDAIGQSLGELRRFVDCFGELPFADQLGMQVARHLADENQRLAAQQIWLRLMNSSQEALRGEATAQIAQGLHQAGLDRLALQFDRQLAGPLAEVVCLDGRTGSECLAAWNIPSLEFAALNQSVDWPQGKVESAMVSTRTDTSKLLRRQIMGVRLERCDSVLGGGNVLFSARDGVVVIRDSFGEEFFRTTPKGGSLSRYPRGVLGSPYGVSRGNLLVLSLGRQLIAFDTLGSGSRTDSKKLWSYQVASSVEGGIGGSYYGSSVNKRLGSYRAQRSQQEGQWVGVIGPVTQDSCILQDQHRLICVDPLTGEEQWTRNNVPVGCDLYGDDQYLFVVPRQGTMAQVYSTLDGRRLDTVKVPSWREQLVTLGRNVIRWRTLADGRRELSAVDALTKKVAWKYEFEARAWIDVALGRFVAVLDSAGRCVIVDARNGQLVVEETLTENPLLNEIHLLAGSDQFVLLASSPPKAGTRGRLIGIDGLNRPDYPIVSGEVYVFDRQTGQPAWSRPAKVRQQALMLTQPLDLPVIAFAGVLARQGSRGSGSGIKMLILDKRFGQLLFENSSLPGSGGGHCVVGRDKAHPHEVTVEMAVKTVRLKFTDVPRPSEPPTVYEAGPAVSQGPGGLYRLGKKLLGGAEE